VSWTKFHYAPRTDHEGDDSTGDRGHRYSNLVGGTNNPGYDDPNSLNVTWHHNWWTDGVYRRMPRVRFGQNHVFNNLYDSADAGYCVRAGIESQLLLGGNYFDGVAGPHVFNNEEDELTAYIQADSSNVYVDTTGDALTGGGGAPCVDPPYQYTLESAEDARDAILREAGPQ
jgi:pectate lyase